MTKDVLSDEFLRGLQEALPNSLFESDGNIWIEADKWPAIEDAARAYLALLPKLQALKEARGKAKAGQVDVVNAAVISGLSKSPMGNIPEALDWLRGCEDGAISSGRFTEVEARVFMTIRDSLTKDRKAAQIDVEKLKFECTKDTADEGQIRVIFNVINYLNSQGYLGLPQSPMPNAGKVREAIEMALGDEKHSLECEWKLEEALALLSDQSPSKAEIPEGWKLVPVKSPVTSDMKAECIGEFSFPTEELKFDDDGNWVGTYTRENVVPWDTCKAIYKAMLSAAPERKDGDE